MESEWLTRKKRIDPRLEAAGWLLRGSAGGDSGAWRVEELPTANGPADYALVVDGKILAIVEAKKLSLGPQNVLTQAERYARGLGRTGFDFGGLRVPFLYATNGEVIWFHDVRSPLSRSRKVSGFHSPEALVELLGRSVTEACSRLAALPNDHPRLRPYQREANADVERALGEHRRALLVAMATGTGKTFTTVNSIYRLMKSGLARRVLFLVDRRALAAQAVRAFSSFEPEPGLKLHKIYEVYSGRFQTEDFGDEDRFDPNLIPTSYLTHPRADHAFIYVCTIQRMAINILGRDAIFGTGDEAIDPDAQRLDIPLNAFDLIVADECHRGYTQAEVSVWRQTLDHFDAIKIGLTATPTALTTSYFTHLAFRYSFEKAVREGHLVDYDVLKLRSGVRLQGVFLKEGEGVEVIDTETGRTQLDAMEDERHYDPGQLEATITAPDSNRKILEELRKLTERHEQETGRFPKTLIFAVNDLPHTSHADQLVDMARDVFGRGDRFVTKITGGVDRPLQRIREFRNRPEPGIAVTVDLLTTGVDIPDLEILVFLRMVGSRVLFEQMVGRGTRRGERFPDKDHFVVVDCFDGTLLDYFRKAAGVTEEAPAPPTRTIVQIIDDIWNNVERDYNIKCLVKRLHRIDKAMAGEGRPLFARFVPEGDLARYATGLTAALRRSFAQEMALLRDPAFQHLLQDYPRPRRGFIRAYEVVDQVSSSYLLRDGDGQAYRSEDYLEAFARYVREEKARVEALGILLDRPSGWSPRVLAELRDKLANHPLRFSAERLEKAHQVRYDRALIDLISMVKHAADEQAPLLTAAERVDRALDALSARHRFTPAQRAWLDRIREHLQANLSIEKEDFEEVPILSREGGWAAARHVFGAHLPALLQEINEGIAA